VDLAPAVGSINKKAGIPKDTGFLTKKQKLLTFLCSCFLSSFFLNCFFLCYFFLCCFFLCGHVFILSFVFSNVDCGAEHFAVRIMPRTVI